MKRAVEVRYLGAGRYRRLGEILKLARCQNHISLVVRFGRIQIEFVTDNATNYDKP